MRHCKSTRVEKILPSFDRISEAAQKWLDGYEEELKSDVENFRKVLSEAKVDDNGCIDRKEFERAVKYIEEDLTQVTIL